MLVENQIFNHLTDNPVCNHKKHLMVENRLVNVEFIRMSLKYTQLSDDEHKNVKYKSILILDSSYNVQFIESQYKMIY
jgi:hypothetical protein